MKLSKAMPMQPPTEAPTEQPMLQPFPKNSPSQSCCPPSLAQASRSYPCSLSPRASATSAPHLYLQFLAARQIQASSLFSSQVLP